MDPWMWLVTGLLCAAVETQLPGSFVSLFFALGAAVAAATTWAGATPVFWQQSLAFAGVSAASMLALRRRMRRRHAPAWTADFDGLVGAEGVVLGALAPGALGQVELRGVPWRACSLAARPLAAGERCVVVRLEGLTLSVDVPASAGTPARVAAPAP